MDDDEIRLEALKLVVQLEAAGRCSSKSRKNTINVADIFVEYITDGEVDWEEEEPSESQSSQEIDEKTGLKNVQPLDHNI